MYVVIAPVVDHTARMSPAIVVTTPCAGCSSRLRRLDPTRFAACTGITRARWCINEVIAAGPAASVNTPTTTSKTDGMAKKALNASADASIVPLSATNAFPPRTAIASQPPICS